MKPTAVWPIGLPHDEARRIYHSQPFTVYRHYDADGVLLYVGCTDNLHRRTVTHRAQSPWWTQVDRVESELFPNYQAACDEEVRLIRSAGPLYNVVFARDREAAKQRRLALVEAS